MSTHHAPGFSTPNRTTAPLLTVNEVAEFMSVSRWTVYRLVRGGQLKTVKAGERLRFRLEDIQEYLERDPFP